MTFDSAAYERFLATKAPQAAPSGLDVVPDLFEIIPEIKRFQAATERSSGYFDIPGSELNGALPIRVAQHPKDTFIVVDERGYPVFGR